jgi:hypothetical protein
MIKYRITETKTTLVKQQLDACIIYDYSWPFGLPYNMILCHLKRVSRK